MTKAIIRYLMLCIVAFIDGLMVILFDKEEITSYSFYAKPITFSQTQKAKVLVEYLEKCHKQVNKEQDNGKKGKQEKFE